MLGGTNTGLPSRLVLRPQGYQTAAYSLTAPGAKPLEPVSATFSALFAQLTIAVAGLGRKLLGVSPTTNAICFLSRLSAFISSMHSGYPGAAIKLKKSSSALASSLLTIAACKALTIMRR